MALPTPDLQYFLKTDSTTSLTNHGSAPGTASWCNGSFGAATGPVAYGSNYVTLDNNHSLNTGFAPNSTFSCAALVYIDQAASFVSIIGVGNPIIITVFHYKVSDTTNVLWGSAQGGVTQMTEPGWMPLGFTVNNTTGMKAIVPGRIARNAVYSTTNPTSIATNTSNGYLIFGGAGYGQNLGSPQQKFSEIAVFKSGVADDDMLLYLETMRQRAVAAGLTVF